MTQAINQVDESPAPFLVAPAPWACKGEYFWFLSYVSSSSPYPSRASFSELERSAPFADPKESGEFKGGLQHIMVVRYTETPVGSSRVRFLVALKLFPTFPNHSGPYDEIIWAPGKFIVPPTGKVVTRITRIYVSTKESVFNGMICYPSTRSKITLHHRTHKLEYTKTSSPLHIHSQRLFHTKCTAILTHHRRAACHT